MNDPAASGSAGVLEATLDGLLRDSGVVVAALLDAGSGMVLASRSGARAPADIETVCAGQADVVRAALDATQVSLRVAAPTEVVVAHGERLHQLLRTVDDPLGDRLVLAVLVEGPPRVLRRVRRRVSRIDPAALAPRPGAVRPTTALPAPPPPAQPGDLFTPAGDAGAAQWRPGDGVGLAALAAPVPASPGTPVLGAPTAAAAAPSRPQADDGHPQRGTGPGREPAATRAMLPSVPAALAPARGDHEPRPLAAGLSAPRETGDTTSTTTVTAAPPLIPAQVAALPAASRPAPERPAPVSAPSAAADVTSETRPTTSPPPAGWGAPGAAASPDTACVLEGGRTGTDDRTETDNRTETDAGAETDGGVEADNRAETTVAVAAVRPAAGAPPADADVPVNPVPAGTRQVLLFSVPPLPPRCPTPTSPADDLFTAARPADPFPDLGADAYAGPWTPPAGSVAPPAGDPVGVRAFDDGWFSASPPRHARPGGSAGPNPVGEAEAAATGVSGAALFTPAPTARPGPGRHAGTAPPRGPGPEPDGPPRDGRARDGGNQVDAAR